MASHIGRDTWHLAWDATIPPVLEVGSGEVVTFDVLDASCGQITRASTVADLAALDFSRVDQVAGPIAVAGAQPGDTLEVELLDVSPADWGWTAAIPGFGLLADDFPDPALRITRLGERPGRVPAGCSDPAGSVLRRAGGGADRDRPRSTIPPTETGGNMDTRHLRSVPACGCRSRSRVRCSAWATVMPRRATGRYAARPSRRPCGRACDSPCAATSG